MNLRFMKAPLMEHYDDFAGTLGQRPRWKHATQGRRPQGDHQPGRVTQPPAIPKNQRFGNQILISRSADSAESDPCTRLYWTSSPKSPRIVPGVAFSTGSVPPAS